MAQGLSQRRVAFKGGNHVAVEQGIGEVACDGQEQ